MIRLYSTGCPSCKVLETKLQSKNIEYEKIESEDAIRDLGYDSAPLLEVDGKILEFYQAVQYVNQQ